LNKESVLEKDFIRGKLRSLTGKGRTNFVRNTIWTSGVKSCVLCPPVG